VWCEAGHFVRVPKYGGDRWSERFGEDDVVFLLIEDHNILAQITGDPLLVKAFL
jgi:hypothetical protein